MAQLNAPPTGDQEVAGLTSKRLATFFCGDMITKYFLPFHDSRRAVSGERMRSILVNRLED